MDDRLKELEQERIKLRERLNEKQKRIENVKRMEPNIVSKSLNFELIPSDVKNSRGRPNGRNEAD